MLLSILKSTVTYIYYYVVSLVTAGLAQTLALRRYVDRKAPIDAECVALLKRAGAIPLVVTNIPTISMWWQTSNHVFGMTSNPYNSHRMVAGSSGINWISFIALKA